jgi:hypothetical protein
MPLNRLILFGDSPDALLIVATEPVRLPPVAPPFTRESVVGSCKEAGVGFRLVEMPKAGRWTDAMKRARADARAEARQQQHAEQSAQATLLRGALSPHVRDRAEVIAKKLEVDAKVRELKEQLSEIGRQPRGLSQDKAFQRTASHLERMRQESQALQVRLGEIKKAEREASQAHEGTRFRKWHRRFVASVKDLLGEEEFREVVEEVNAMLEAEAEQQSQAIAEVKPLPEGHS